eukprot:2400927-Alexandrium_andersonii.AAC.1
MAAGNRRVARQLTTGDGRAWITNLAADVLGWERDLTEDGDVEAQPGPRTQVSEDQDDHRCRWPTRAYRAWIRDLTSDGD